MKWKSDSFTFLHFFQVCFAVPLPMIGLTVVEAIPFLSHPSCGFQCRSKRLGLGLGFTFPLSNHHDGIGLGLVQVQLNCSQHAEQFWQGFLHFIHVIVHYKLTNFLATIAELNLWPTFGPIQNPIFRGFQYTLSSRVHRPLQSFLLPFCTKMVLQRHQISHVVPALGRAF